MKKLFFALAVMLFGFSALAQNTGNLLNSYIRVKDALTASDSRVASEAAAMLYEAVNNEADFAGKAELAKATGKLREAGGDLKKQRSAFKDVSTVMWKLVKRSEVDTPVYYQYCPMKKAYWLSREEAIKNPYFGASMLTCGKVAEIKS